MAWLRAARGLFGEEGDVIADREVQVLVTATGILVAGQFLVSPLISDLAGVFGVSEARAGLLMIAYTAPPIVAIPVCGVLADRIGQKRVFVPGLVLFGLAGAGVTLQPSFEAVLGLRVLQGVGFGAATPLTIAMFGSLYSGNREATAQSLRATSIYSTNMLGPIVASVLFLTAWYAPFALYALALPVAAWAWVDLPAGGAAGETSLVGYLRELVSLLQLPVMALVLTSFVFRFVVFFGFLTYVSVLATREVGLAVVAAGSIVSIKGFVSLLSATQGGRLTARYDSPSVLAVAFATSGVGAVLMGAVPTVGALVAGTAMIGVGDGVVNPVQKNLVNELATDHLRAGAISTATTFQNVGMAAGPAAMGLVLALTDARVAFVALGVVGGFGGAGLLLLARRLRGT